MNILVCVKHVPREEDLKLDRETNTLIRTNGEGEINPLDKYALELALKAKEKFGGAVTAMTMGPDGSKGSLKYALSVGVDNVCLLSDRALGGADAYATAYTLAAGVRRLEKEYGAFDLVLCGKNSNDGDTFLVAPALAENLGLAHATGVVDYTAEETGIEVRRETDAGFETLRLAYPAVLSVAKTAGGARFPNIKLKLAANRREIPVFNAAELGLDASEAGSKGSLTSVGSSFVPEHSKDCTMIDEETEEAAAEKLVSQLSKNGLI